MKNKIIKMLLPVLLLSLTVTAFSKEKEPAMAGVAMIKYQNKTGSANYDWITNTLPDAVFNSMKEVFEFNRVNPSIIETAIDSMKITEFTPNLENMGAIAKKASTDIVISGIYTYDKDSNLIEITTYVYHTSRNAITAQIKTESPVNNKMFRLVDLVALKIVEHIKIIASEDYKKQGKIVAVDKPQEKGAKPQKIILIKAAERFDYSSWYVNVSNSMIFMFGPLATSIPYGVDIKLNFTNSYKSIVIFGATVSYAMIFPVVNTEFTNYPTVGMQAIVDPGMAVIDLKAMAGLNFSIKQRVYIQPYVAVGGALQIVALETVSSTGLNPPSNPYKTKMSFQYQGDFSVSAGIRFPIRLAGYDMFLTPFVEFCSFPFHVNFISYIQAGVGISL